MILKNIKLFFQGKFSLIIKRSVTFFKGKMFLKKS